VDKGSAGLTQPRASNTLYLVSASKAGRSYWKVGITHHENPICRDSKHYLEVFRAEQSQDSHLIELAIARTFNWVMQGSLSDGFAINQPPAREGLSYDFPVDVPVRIYDWWLDLARNSDRVPNPHYQPELGNLQSLLDERHDNGNYTEFDFCWRIIKKGPGLFDFNVPAADFRNATTETLREAFSMWKGPLGGFIDDDAVLRNAAEHWFGLAHKLIPQLQYLCSFRPERQTESNSLHMPPMWS